MNLLPNVPTDNLYKFLGVSGLVMTLVSMVFPAYFIHSINEEVAQLKKKAFDLNSEMLALELDILGAAQNLPLAIPFETPVEEASLEPIPLDQEARSPEQRRKVTNKFAELKGTIAYFQLPVDARSGRKILEREVEISSIKETYGIDKPQLHELVSSMTDEQIENGFSAARERAMKLTPLLSEVEADVYRQWDLRDELWWLRLAEGIGVFLGLMLTVSGFSAWYFQLQRYQDAIVKRQANDHVGGDS